MAGQPVCSRSWLEKAHLDLYSAECLMEHHPAPMEDICPRFVPFSVVVRYPNELDVEEADAEWALETSRKIYEFTAMKLELLQKEPLEQNGGMEQTMS